MVEKLNFKSINDALKYKIKLPQNTSSNDLVSYLTSKGELNHFVEVIPSANDIFIETIQKRQGLQIACIEEIAYKNGWITKKQVAETAEIYKKNSYGQYLIDFTK